MRNIIIAGNWKMNKDKNETLSFCAELKQKGLDNPGSESSKPSVEVIVSPAYPFLDMAVRMLETSPIRVAAQNVSLNEDGAFTGEVSATMLASIPVKYCIVGHSERRQYHNETDQYVQARIVKLMHQNLIPIVCIGESLAQREAGETATIVLSQLEGCLKDIDITDASRIVLAYEPVWAIGTGKNATPEQAQEVHALIRNRLQDMYGATIAERMIILYGGSMKPENIESLLMKPDIDGGLIGGASLKLEHFCAMIDCATKIVQTRR